MNRPPLSYRFGPYELDLDRYALRCDGQSRDLEPKALAVLAELLRRPGHVFGRDDLLDAVWGSREVTPNVLSRAVALLRRTLGDDPRAPRYIETVHTKGYRFIAPVDGDDGSLESFIRHVARLDSSAYCREVLQGELAALIDLINPLPQRFPMLAYHLAILTALLGDEKSGVKLLELSIDHGLEELQCFEEKQLWQSIHQRLRTPD